MSISIEYEKVVEDKGKKAPPPKKGAAPVEEEEEKKPPKPMSNAWVDLHVALHAAQVPSFLERSIFRTRELTFATAHAFSDEEEAKNDHIILSLPPPHTEGKRALQKKKEARTTVFPSLPFINLRTSGRI